MTIHGFFYYLIAVYIWKSEIKDHYVWRMACE